MAPTTAPSWPLGKEGTQINGEITSELGPVMQEYSESFQREGNGLGGSLDAECCLSRSLSLPIEFLASSVKNRREIELLFTISSTAANFDRLVNNFESIAVRSQALQEAWDTLWLAQEPFLAPAIPVIGQEMSGVNRARAFLIKRIEREIQNLQGLAKVLLHFVDVNCSVAEELQNEGVERLAADKLLLVEVEQEIARRINLVCDCGSIRLLSPMSQFVASLSDKPVPSKPIFDGSSQHKIGSNKKFNASLERLEKNEHCAIDDDAHSKSPVAQSYLNQVGTDEKRTPDLNGVLMGNITTPKMPCGLVATQGSMPNTSISQMEKLNDVTRVSAETSSSTAGSSPNVETLITLLNNSSSASEERLPRQEFQNKLDHLSERILSGKNRQECDQDGNAQVTSVFDRLICDSTFAEQPVREETLKREKELDSQTGKEITFVARREESAGLYVNSLHRDGQVDDQVVDGFGQTSPNIDLQIQKMEGSYLLEGIDKATYMDGHMIGCAEPPEDCEYKVKCSIMRENDDIQASEVRITPKKRSLQETIATGISSGERMTFVRINEKRMLTGNDSKVKSASPIAGMVDEATSNGESIHRNIDVPFERLDMGTSCLDVNIMNETGSPSNTISSTSLFCSCVQQSHDAPSESVSALRSSLSPEGKLLECNHWYRRSLSATPSLLHGTQTSDKSLSSKSCGQEDEATDCLDAAKNKDITKSASPSAWILQLPG